MNQASILRRHLCILRQVQPPFTYPSKLLILEYLLQEDLGFVSKRTFERDLKEIESYYGIRVCYCPRNRGYFLDQPVDEDLSHIQQFFQLLERCERLAFLTQASDVLSTSKYLLLEENGVLAGLEHLPVLWEALRSQRQLTFQYKTFQSDEVKHYQVEPLVLLEYRNRWYLAAVDIADDRFKTFGLERMKGPELTYETVRVNRRPEFLALKKDALGVFFCPEDIVERVVLKVSANRSPYLMTVPIHSSQKKLTSDKHGITLELMLIISPELEREILGYGEHLEVLEPRSLREKIKSRVQALLQQYHE
jgi:predicted DNA-binding transcriptional regulator YafY